MLILLTSIVIYKKAYALDLETLGGKHQTLAALALNSACTPSPKPKPQALKNPTPRR